MYGPRNRESSSGRRITSILALTAGSMIFAACGGGGSHNTSINGGQTTGTTGRPTTVREHCSNPNPDPSALTFAGVVCVLRQATVPQSDGSNLIEVYVKVTDKDPNAFTVQSWDFNLLDASGTSADASQYPGCIYQPDLTDGFPLSPRQSITLSGPLCFDVPSSYQPQQLVWQSDVSVPLA